MARGHMDMGNKDSPNNRDNPNPTTRGTHRSRNRKRKSGYRESPGSDPVRESLPRESLLRKSLLRESLLRESLLRESLLRESLLHHETHHRRDRPLLHCVRQRRAPKRIIRQRPNRPGETAIL